MSSCMARRGVVTAAVLGFAHTVGEFGVVLMIGGNIPGATRVISTQLYSHVEALEYPAAHRLAAALLVFSFAVLWWVYRLRPRTGMMGGVDAGTGAADAALPGAGASALLASSAPRDDR